MSWRDLSSPLVEPCLCKLVPKAPRSESRLRGKEEVILPGRGDAERPSEPARAGAEITDSLSILFINCRLDKRGRGLSPAQETEPADRRVTDGSKVSSPGREGLLSFFPPRRLEGSRLVLSTDS